MIWENSTIFLKFGGTLLFYGVHLYVNSSFFQRNNGLVGGAICIDFSNYDIQNFIIENSDFEDNYSENGGAIGIDVNVLNITGVIQKNHFLRNWATCILKYN